jgi:molecular chaperone DnaK (HSP70)
MTVVGFDFGTTNSLASVVIGNEVITFLENEQLAALQHGPWRASFRMH